MDLSSKIQENEEALKPLREKQKEYEVMEKYGGSDKVVPHQEIVDWLTVANTGAPERVYTKIPKLDSLVDGFRPGQLIVLSAPTGNGKCFGKGTEILMFDGTIKNVEDVVVGDTLMGNDSTPRNVLSLGRGREMMYSVSGNDGDCYVVNESHILSLKETGVVNKSKYRGIVTSKRYRKGGVVNIEVGEYLKKSKTFRHTHKGYRAERVGWREKSVKIDPYFLGLWLGDGHSDNTAITTADKEVVQYLYSYANELGLHVRVEEQENNKSSIYYLVGRKGKKNVLRELLRGEGVWRNKHIPLVYMANSIGIRLKILAGLIDSDGYVNGSGLEFVNKNENIVDGVVFICRSLGLNARKKEFRVGGSRYYKVGIMGDACKDIPLLLIRKVPVARNQVKDVLVNGIIVEPLGIDNYYGFEIDGNKLFLLGDFTVVHNTALLQHFTREFRGQANCLWFNYEMGMEEFIERFGDDVPAFFAPRSNKESSLAWLKARIIEGVAKYNTRVVFIDHLHFILDMKMMFQLRNTSLAIGALMREIKKLAIEHELIIFLVSHLSKTKIEDVPQIDDLRDSSFVGQESDIVLIMWQIMEKDRENRKLLIPTNDAIIMVAKNRRNGRRGYAKCRFDRGRFIEIANIEEPK